jgi:hypothetical protein
MRILHGLCCRIRIGIDGLDPCPTDEAMIDKDND